MEATVTYADRLSPSTTVDAFAARSAGARLEPYQ